jgi:choline dehydrogenase-like flavoprotein
MWQFSPPTRFGTKYREEIVNAQNLHLYTYANVTNIEANASVRTVSEVQAKTLDGKTHRVKAKHYVLACGSIQNARLLLASNQKASAGLGNDNDLVGRFFMEHFEMGCAQVMLEQPANFPLYTLRFNPRMPSGELAVSEQMQRQHRILNGTASVRGGTFPEELSSFFQIFEESGGFGRRSGRSDQGAERIRRAFNRPPPSPEGRHDYKLASRAEQAPNPDSRVVLSTEKDALGVPYADLHWKLSALDKRSMRSFYEILGEEFGRAGLGRVQLLDWLLEDDTTWPSFLSGGFHHMGTTRMHDDPKQGVLDANAKVHSVENLYAAGASAFPTAGAPNPTLTLVALSIRLSDHIKGKMT